MLTHETDAARIEIAYDPAVPEYRLDLTLSGEAWAASPSFGMAFEGARSLTIGTGRHTIRGGTLSVADSGFGNVLDGLEFNRSATAFTTSQAVSFSLQGVAEPVQRFRRCVEQPPVTS